MMPFDESLLAFYEPNRENHGSYFFDWTLSDEIAKIVALRPSAWWVETLNVMAGSGLAARLCARAGDVVLVQHSGMLADYPRAVFVGELD